MSEPRRARLSVTYEGKDITEQISLYIKSFVYTDVASGASDSVTIDLLDRDKKWMGVWHPSKSDGINVKIYLYNWNKQGTKTHFNCGHFTVDDLSYSGRPLECILGATSLPWHECFNSTKRTKTWKKVTIEEIAKEVASRSNLKLYYDAAKITIASIEQNRQEDCKFLYSVCEDYGLAMKIFSNKIVIFNEDAYERKKPVKTFSENDVLKWSYNTSIAGTYTGARVSYTSPKSSKTNIVKIGSGNRILDVNVSAASGADAELKGKARLNLENKKSTTMSVSIYPDHNIVASSCVKFVDFMHLSGVYYVDKVKHKIDANSNYTMDLELHYVGKE